MSWRCVDASAVGVAHLRADTPCQDRCVSAVVVSGDGAEVLVSIVSDGAGSAAHGERGAQLVCDTLVEVCSVRVRGDSDLDAIDDDAVRAWFLTARERLQALADAAAVDIREYAATALLALASDRRTLCARIGDGAIVVRRSADEAFEVALWPEAGEYANQTYFITDETAAERIGIARFADVCDVIAFSDGLQNLALEQATRSAFAPFFLPLVTAVRRAASANGTLRRELTAYLHSDPINERTDDDKSLVVGCRMVPA